MTSLVESARNVWPYMNVRMQTMQLDTRDARASFLHWRKKVQLDIDIGRDASLKILRGKT